MSSRRGGNGGNMPRAMIAAGCVVLGTEGIWRTGTTGTMLSLRAGYAFRSSSDGRQPFTAGGGITLGRLEVDYAYEGFDLIGGATSRVGVRYAALPRGL